MSSTTDFVAELFVAANTIGKMSIFERRRLLERALSSIRDLSDRAGGDSKEALKEKRREIEKLAAEIDDLPEELAAHALCEAADLIRGLHVASAWTAAPS